MQNQTTRCGYVALVGRPNVGKSTLLNKILGQKLSITSKKPQTTRHQILGIYTEEATQILFMDTPGLHLAEGKRDKQLNHLLNQTATQAVQDVDVAVFVIDRTRWHEEDQLVLNQLQKANKPVIAVINKIDKLDAKTELLPFLQELATRYNFAALIPMSAKHGQQLPQLLDEITQLLPESDHFYSEDQLTDRSSRFLAAELVREQLMRHLGEEVPYSLTVEIESYKQQGKTLHIHALIWVEREGQKKILIGNKGEKMKLIGTNARLAMQEAFDTKIMLNLWVKVKSNWADSPNALKSLGYGPNS